MSELRVAPPAPGLTGYAVETAMGCKIIRGSVPVRDFLALAKAAAPGALVDCQMAARLGASFVLGTPAALQALHQAKLEACARVQAEISTARAAGLSGAALEWLDGLQRCTCTDALFSSATKVRVGEPARREDWPRDPAELRWCMELARSVPEVSANLRTAGNRMGPVWIRLIANWESLRQLLAQGDDDACRAAMKKCGC